MNAAKRSLQMIAALVLASLGVFPAMVSAASGVTECVEHERRYFLRDFDLAEDVGMATFIDAFDRSVLTLTCGRAAPGTTRIEVACASSANGEGLVVRVRIHAQRDLNLPRLGLVEVQRGTSRNATINEIVPVVCE